MHKIHTRHDGLRYRIGVSGDTVIAEDKQTSSLQAYQKRMLGDGTHQLDIVGSIKTVQGNVVGVSNPAEATGYRLQEERGSIILSRKTDPSWRMELAAANTAIRKSLGAKQAILKLRGNVLAFADGAGIFRLDPVPSGATGKGPIYDHADDFSP